MQFVEVTQQSASKMYCPFCGELVVDEDKAPDINPCGHTMFIATSEGFEYSAKPFNELCAEFGIDGLDWNVQEVLDEVDDAAVVCFVLLPPPPAMLELYVGFSGSLFKPDADQNR